MASLSQTIRTGSGQLQTVSGLDSALQAGLQAPPVTPMGTAGLPETNPDVAKMSGTPAQKTNALRLAIQGQADLGTRQRQTQVRTQATAGEQKQLSLAQTLSGIGGLNARVPTLVAQMTQGATQQALTQPVQLTGDVETNKLVQNLASNPMDFTSAQQLAVKLGIPAPTDTVSMTAFQTALAGKIPGFAESGAGQQLASAQGALTLTDADWQSMGLENTQAAADLLGLTPEQLGGMNVSQVIDAVQTEIYTDFAETGQWEQKANDPTLGATERAEARAHLRDLGAVGVTSAVAGMDKLADDLMDAKQVDINGEMIDIEDLLSSDFISGLAKSYLEGSDEDKAEFQKNEPDLAKFFDTYKDAIGKVVDQIDVGMQNYANLQMKNAALAKTATGNVLSSDIMKTVFPDWGTASVEGMTTDMLPNGGAVFQALQGRTGLSSTQIDDLYNAIQQLGPSYSHELLSTFTLDELQRFGFTDRNSPQWKQFQMNVQAANNLASITPNSSLDQFARLTGASSMGDISSRSEKALEMAQSGLFGSAPGAISALSPEALRAQALQMQQNLPRTLHAVANFDNTLQTEYGRLQEYTQQPVGLEYKAIEPYLQVGATINQASAGQIADNTDTTTLGNIITKTKFTDLFTPEAQSFLIRNYQDRYIGENLMPLARAAGFDGLSGAAPGINTREVRLMDIDQAANSFREQAGKIPDVAYAFTTPAYKAVENKGRALTEAARDNLRDLNDLYNNAQMYLTSLSTFRDGTPSVQVGPMASRFSSLLSEAKGRVAQIQQMKDYYTYYTNPDWYKRELDVKGQGGLIKLRVPQGIAAPTSATLAQTLKQAGG